MLGNIQQVPTGNLAPVQAQHEIGIAPHAADASASVSQASGQPAADAQGQVPSVSWSEASNVAFKQGLKDAVSVLGASGVNMCVQAAARAGIAAAGAGPVATLALAGATVLLVNSLATGYMAHSFVPTKTAGAIGAVIGAGIVASAVGPAWVNGGTQDAAVAAVRMLGISVYSGLRDVLQGALKPEVSDLVKAPNLAMLPENGTKVTAGPASAYGRVAAATAFYGAMQMGAAGLASYVFPQVSDPALKDFCTAATRTVVEGFDTAAGVLLKRAMHPNDVRIKGPSAQHPPQETWSQYLGGLAKNVGDGLGSVARQGSFRIALNSLGPMLTSVVPSRLPGVTGEPFASNAWTAITEVRGQLVNWAEQVQTARENANIPAAVPDQEQHSVSNPVNWHESQDDVVSPVSINVDEQSLDDEEEREEDSPPVIFHVEAQAIEMGNIAPVLNLSANSSKQSST